jgi:hypothetical protein
MATLTDQERLTAIIESRLQMLPKYENGGEWAMWLGAWEVPFHQVNCVKCGDYVDSRVLERIQCKCGTVREAHHERNPLFNINTQRQVQMWKKAAMRKSY